jgi:hypothetical protein
VSALPGWQLPALSQHVEQVAAQALIGVHCWLLQVSPERAQLTHDAPPIPQRRSEVPGRQLPPLSQQPEGQLCASHTGGGGGIMHCWLPHVAPDCVQSWHWPPPPPHARSDVPFLHRPRLSQQPLAQLCGSHDACVWQEPPDWVPGTHTCPVETQLPHAWPRRPHAAGSVPARHCVEKQQPAQLVPSHCGPTVSPQACSVGLQSW